MTEAPVGFDWDAIEPEEQASPSVEVDPFIVLRSMARLMEWASGSKARLLAVQIALMQDRRGVREAALSAKLDRTHLYRCIREARRLIRETTAQPA
jgi:hypothetical protein